MSRASLLPVTDNPSEIRISTSGVSPSRQRAISSIARCPHKGKHYLVKGDIATQTATVLRENVECPSLSPNGTRIAYKKRLQSGDRVVWELHVLHLASGRDTSLDEERSVDDQLEWLDNERVLYALPATETTASASRNMGGCGKRKSRTGTVLDERVLPICRALNLGAAFKRRQG
jgi:hypothetical protein